MSEDRTQKKPVTYCGVDIEKAGKLTLRELVAFGNSMGFDVTIQLIPVADKPETDQEKGDR